MLNVSATSDKTAEMLESMSPDQLKMVSRVIDALADNEPPKPAQVAQSAAPLPEPLPTPQPVVEVKIEDNLLSQMVVPIALKLMQHVFNPVDIMTGQINLQDVFDHLQDAIIETLPTWDHVALVGAINAATPASEGRYVFVPSEGVQ